MSLDAYRKKRNFARTPEPEGKQGSSSGKAYLIQKHDASHLHYDFRLELDGTLKSWAVPKGPCLDPSVKRLAVHVEDHPLAYGTFEGIIPKGQYGGGTVMLWDKGEWHCLDDNPGQAYKKGHLRIELTGEKLHGRWDLIRFKDEKNWFLIKGKDSEAIPLSEYDITIAQPDSVSTQRSLTEIANAAPSHKSSLLEDLPDSPFPTRITPQLATLVDKPPEDDQWLHEIKLDGYRMLAFKQDKSVQIQSRNHHDWTEYFPNIVAEIASLPIKNVVFDGEIVLMDKENRSNFQLLQNAIKNNKNAHFLYYIFDCIYAEKHDLKSLSQLKRKNILANILDKKSSLLKYSDHIIGDGKEMYRNACQMKLEGIVSKNISSPYAEQRSKSWLKVKCILQQELVIGGYSKPTGARKHFGALYMGFFNDKSEFIYCGKVGTGFTDASLKEVHAALEKIEIPQSPFTSKVPGALTATWVKPTLVAEIKFSEWTDEGRLRHPSFQGVRLDKKATLVKRESAMPVKKLRKRNESHRDQQPIKLTHPDKILYPEDNITKQEVFNYYETIAPWILPYIIRRPLTLLRCPENHTSCFYQRHLGNAKSASLKSIKITEKKDNPEHYFYIDDEEGLFQLIQMSVLEIHPWNCTIGAIETPDIIIFDLDPAPDVSWKKVVAAAFEIREQLKQYRLTSFIKTTGGKGLHVVIPIKPQHDWEKVKHFTHVFVEFLEQLHPDLYISKMTKSKRKGKIFIDYLRNQRSATAISPYSTRARLHAPVATPVHWDELTQHIEDTQYTLKTLPARLQKLSEDPWKDFWEVRQLLPWPDKAT